MTTQVTDVLKTYSNDDLEGKLLQYLQGAATPVTDWFDSGFLRSLLMDWAQNFLGDYLNPADPDPAMRQSLVSGPVPALAAAPTKGTSAWLTLACEQLFSVRRNFKLDGTQFAGTFTQQAVTMSCDATHGPYSIAAGTFFLRSSVTGNRYKAITSGTVPNNGSVIITFQAESPNDSANGSNFADGAGTLTDIRDNPLPGLSASNLGPSFSGVIPTPNPATGLGVVTAGGSTPASPSAYDVQILVAGQVGTATFQYRTNGGAWSASNATASSFTIPGGPTVHFANDGGGANPSFLVGDIYSFQSPGTAITQQGLDPETDAALLIRCVARWPDLSPGAVSDKHVVWAKAASTLVTRARPTLGALPGFLNLTIAGASNPLADAVVTAVQLYTDQHEAIGDQTVVAKATLVNVNSVGNVYVVATKLSAVQAAASFLWGAWVKSTDIGGIIRAAKLEQFLMDSGATNLDSIFVNGSTDLILAYNEVGIAADIVAGLTWVSI